MTTQIKLPNFDEVSQPTVKAYILSVLKRTAAILKFYFRFQFSSSPTTYQAGETLFERRAARDMVIIARALSQR